MRLISNGQWNNLKQVNGVDPSTLKIFANVRNKLISVDGNIVLRGNRILIPDAQQVSTDFFEVAGHYVLVAIDDYSRSPEVKIVHSTSAKAVLPKLDGFFAAYGVPQVFKSDNGPPFNGHEFAQLQIILVSSTVKLLLYGQKQMAKSNAS